METEVRGRFMEWHHLPIRDVSVPDAEFERSWPANAARLQALIDAGANVLRINHYSRGKELVALERIA